jgi:hypothetical protein
LIVCYANGGGLGHLTRIRAYLHTRSVPAAGVTILTASPFAGDRRVTGDCAVRRVPADLDRDGLTAWIAAALASLRPAELVVDAFPAGLAGELTASVIPPDVRVVHLARLLHWDAYRPLLPAVPPRFAETWLIEPVTAPHSEYLRSVSSAVGPLTLAEPPAVAPEVAGWLIVHAGPAAEIAELVAYAGEMAELEGVRPRLTLVSPGPRPDVLPPEVAHLDVYPAWPLFGSAERIITAAGCNAVRQLAPWRDRHRMMPFPRRFDDQYARAARLRISGAPAG